MDAASLIVTLEGSGGRHLPYVPERPDWWRDAACRESDPSEWIVERDRAGQLKTLRQVCARCPVAGECLRDALVELDPYIRRYGAMRSGITGSGWSAVEALVAELDPSTPDDWSVLASWCVDGDLRESKRKQTAAA